LKHDYAGGIPHLQEAVRLDPNNLLYLEILGQSYWRSGDARSAIGPLTKAVDLEPGWESANIRMNLAQAFDLLGPTAEAQRQVLKTLEVTRGRDGHRAEVERMWGPLLAKFRPQ